MHVYASVSRNRGQKSFGLWDPWLPLCSLVKNAHQSKCRRLVLFDPTKEGQDLASRILAQERHGVIWCGVCWESGLNDQSIGTVWSCHGHDSCRASSRGAPRGTGPAWVLLHPEGYYLVAAVALMDGNCRARSVARHGLDDFSLFTGWKTVK